MSLPSFSFYRASSKHYQELLPSILEAHQLTSFSPFPFFDVLYIHNYKDNNIVVNSFWKFYLLLGAFPIFYIPGISCMYFFDIAVLRYSGDKKFDYLFFDKKRFENRYNVTAISPRLLYIMMSKN